MVWLHVLKNSASSRFGAISGQLFTVAGCCFIKLFVKTTARFIRSTFVWVNKVLLKIEGS